MVADWFDLAAILKKPVWLLKQIMPMSEFRLWQAWMRLDFERPTKEDYYFAQLASTMHNAWWKKKRPLNDFLLSFTRSDTKVTVETPDERKARVSAEHKAYFAVAIGVGRKK